LLWLLSALAATAALAAYGEGAEEGLTPATVAPPSLPYVHALAMRRPAGESVGDPFVAAVPEVVIAVPRAPTLNPPPPLAWRVIGKQQEASGSWTVFLAHGEATAIVRAGDMLDDDFRVADIKPPRLTLLEVKRKVRRTLDIGEDRQ
jgi:hypothetical protein